MHVDPIRIKITNEQRIALFGEQPSQQEESFISRLPESHWSKLHKHEWMSESQAQAFFVQWWRGRPKTCKCEDSEIILAENPMRFANEQEFFASGVELHNAVNAKLQAEMLEMCYPPVTIQQALSMWRSKAPCTASKLVITVATGQDAKRLLKHTGPRMQAYASQCGADYLEITNDVFLNWHFNKLRVGEFAAQYEQTLFFDADAFPTHKCRNLFAESDAVAVVNDWNTLVRNRVTDWVYPEYRMVMQSQDREACSSWERCLNSGVLLCSREHNPWVMPEKPLPSVHCAEQFWVDANITEYTELDQVCNWQWWRGKDFWRGLPDAEVIHFANCPREDRLELIKWAVEEF